MTTFKAAEQFQLISINERVYFENWLQRRGLKANFISNFERLSDLSSLKKYLAITNNFFLTNPSIVEVKATSEVIIDIIASDANERIPQLNLTERFKWNAEVLEWAKQLVQLKSEITKTQINTKEDTKDSASKKSKLKVVSSERGLQYDIKFVENGFFISAFVSSSEGSKQLKRLIDLAEGNSKINSFSKEKSSDQLYIDCSLRSV